MTKINKKSKQTRVKIRNIYHPIESTRIDTSTGKPELLLNLMPYLDINNNIAFTSDPVYLICNEFYYNDQDISKDLDDDSDYLLNHNRLNQSPHIICRSLLSGFNNIVKLNLTNELYKKYNSNRYDTYIDTNQNYNYSSYRYRPEIKAYSVSNSFEFKKLLEFKFLDNNSCPEEKLSFLNKYTYGFELETASYDINDNVENNYGFVKLYDGSISGPEYTSIPFTPNNFYLLRDFLKIIKSVSHINTSCSLHIHVGGVEYSDDNLIALYSLFNRLQTELNMLLIPYKKNPVYLANTLKNNGKQYSQDLPELPFKNLSNIHKLLGIENINMKEYLLNNRKWNIPGRYFCINFINYLANVSDSNTIEFRNLQMSTNYNYILTWLIANVSIIDYVINNTTKVLEGKTKILLEDCITEFIPDIDVRESVLNNIINIKTLTYNLTHVRKDVDININDFDYELEKILNNIVIDNSITNTIPMKVSKNNNLLSVISKIYNNNDLINDYKLNLNIKIINNDSFFKYSSLDIENNIILLKDSTSKLLTSKVFTTKLNVLNYPPVFIINDIIVEVDSNNKETLINISDKPIDSESNIKYSFIYINGDIIIIFKKDDKINYIKI